MKNKDIESLKEALQNSPDNLPLRIMLGDKYFHLNQIEEAESEYQVVLEYDKNNIRAKEGLAEIYFRRGRYSGVIVIVEELIARQKVTERMLVICAKSLVREKSLDEAQEIYEKILDHNPDFEDKELDENLRMPSVNFDDDEMDEDDPFGFGFDGELDDKYYLMEKPEINFKDVGGMDHVKQEIDLKIIKPLENADLYAAYGKKIGGGILLYGPPGCGKTFLAKATAGQINANFINVGISDILDMWIGRSEKNMGYTFEVARRNTPCVLFFDEVDALGASRSDMKNSSGRHVINQFLAELDGIQSNNDGILVIGATNAPWHLDPAFRRPGRFDRIIFVPPPDQISKQKILEILLKGKPTEKIDFAKVAEQAKYYSGADLKALVDLAIEEKLKVAFKTGVPEPITTQDLLAATKRHHASTREWFNTAKNYALFANESGIYDEILKYIK
ncbi:MAG: AAA family ATPase [Saprospiraceae bacterium]|jgi:transitional endoplasmic reticulum ATPase|nr:AAA family ATPase [Saprospiraceae bacterium]MBK6667577.1 AAA family ATPase [Saprospiraceae bacterium]MBK8827242.1 AAA family ATPase [Saprospiraceae bacterium]MBK9581035.1 AAA family ATPase [Saprospiraceae bacterium]MBK9742151.1 AAA family ATPase [Saprospiraceae bacterium]